MNIRIMFLVFNHCVVVGFLIGRRVESWDVDSRLFLLWCLPVALGLCHLFQGLEMKDVENRLVFFFKSAWCVDPSLLLFLITISFCRRRSLFFLIALHVKQGILYCFSVWICRTFTALGLWSPRVFLQPLMVASELLLILSYSSSGEDGPNCTCTIAAEVRNFSFWNSVKHSLMRKRKIHATHVYHMDKTVQN